MRTGDRDSPVACRGWACGSRGAAWCVRGAIRLPCRSLLLHRAASNALDDHCNALSHADAHRAQRVASAGSAQLIERGGDETCATRAERMAKRNGAAVGINVRGVVGQAMI